MFLPFQEKTRGKTAQCGGKGGKMREDPKKNGAVPSSIPEPEAGQVDSGEGRFRQSSEGEGEERQERLTYLQEKKKALSTPLGGERKKKEAEVCLLMAEKEKKHPMLIETEGKKESALQEITARSERKGSDVEKEKGGGKKEPPHPPATPRK